MACAGLPCVVWSWLVVGAGSGVVVSSLLLLVFVVVGVGVVGDNRSRRLGGVGLFGRTEAHFLCDLIFFFVFFFVVFDVFNSLVDGVICIDR